MVAPASLFRIIAATGVVAAIALTPVGPAAAASGSPGGPKPIVTITPPGTNPAPKPAQPKKPVPAKKLPAPKIAAAAAVDVGVAITGTKINAGSQTKRFTVTVKNNTKTAGAIAKSVNVTVKVTPTDSPAQISVPGPVSTSCKPVAGKQGEFTCAIGDIQPGSKRNLEFVYGTTSNATAHDNAAKIDAEASATTPPDPNTANNKATGQIDILPASVDLGVRVPDTNTALPAGQATTIAEIRNGGSQNAANVKFAVRAPNGTSIHSVNLADTQGGYGVKCTKTSSTGASCTVGTLAAGHFTKARIILNVTGTAAAGSTLDGGLGSVSGGPATAQSAAPNKKVKFRKITSTKASTLAAQADGDDPSDNSDTYAVPISTNPKADLGVTTTAVTGKLSSTATVKGKVSNHGPGTAKGVTVMVTVPSDTGYAAVPSNCQSTSEPRTKKCSFGDLAPYKSKTFEVKVSVGADKPGTDGKVAVSSTQVADVVAKNNSAPLKITVATADNAGNTAGNDKGSLANTGNHSGLVAFGGAFLLLLGGALTLVARRRRTIA